MNSRRGALVLLAAVALTCGSAAPFAQDAGRGEALLAAARAALGGEERLGAVKAVDVRGDLVRAAGQARVEGELQIRIEQPDRFRRDEDVSLPGSGPSIVRTEVLNGTSVWTENSGGGGMFAGRVGRGDDARGGRRGGRGPIDPAQIEEAQRRMRQAELSRLLLAWLLVTDGTIAWIGTAEAPDGRADVLQVTPAAGPPIRLFLDEASHLPLMMTWQAAAPQVPPRGRRGDGSSDAASGPPPQTAPPQGTFTMTLGDYKLVGGIRLPHFVTRAVDGTTVEEWSIDGYRLNPSFRADVFTR